MIKLYIYLILITVFIGCGNNNSECFFNKDFDEKNYLELAIEDVSIKEFISGLELSLCSNEQLTTSDFVLVKEDSYVPTLAIKCPNSIVDIFTLGSTITVLNKSKFLIGNDTVNLNEVINDIEYFYHKNLEIGNQSKSIILFPDDTKMIDVHQTLTLLYKETFNQIYKNNTSIDCSFYSRMRTEKNILFGINYRGNIPSPPPNWK
jgi:hypothetical protein